MAVAGQHHFRVTIDNTNISFAKISSIEKSMEYEVLQEGGNNLAPRLLPLPQKQIKTLRMERGVQEYNSTLSSLRPGSSIATGIGIEVLDVAGTVLAHYTVEGVTLVKWEIAGLDALSNNVLLETFEVTYTGIKREEI